ncbi:MAG: choice-of-anchor D domain-containing protein [Deltaproteobacteria bacterium]|nr:choice-of-anchor D domain-containing protein [Deltaproteobacteria bacterium]
MSRKPCYLLALLCLAAATPVACGGDGDTLVVVEIARGTAVGDVTRIEVQLDLGGQTATRTLDHGGGPIALPTDALFGIRSGAGPIKVTATATIGSTTISGDTAGTVTRGDTTRIKVILGSHIVDPCTPAPCDDGGGTPRLELDRTTQDFGDVLVGQRSLPVQLTVTNRGDAATSAITTTLAASTGTPFVVSADTCATQTLAAAASCTVSLEFAPTIAGDLTGTLTLSAVTGGQVQVTLAGRASTAGDLAASPDTLSLGSVAVGGVSATQTVTILNRGGSATGALMVDVTGTDAAEFPLPSDGCSAQPLAATSSCQITVRFQPSMAGGRQASLRVRATPGGTALVALSGDGLSAGSLRFDQATRDLGSVLQGTPSATITLRVSNTGQSPTGVPAFTLTGLQASDFEIVNHTCSAALAANAGCDVNLRMTPSAPGPRAAQLEVRATPGGATTAALSGTGLAAANFVWSPAGQDFGGVTVGSLSSATLTLSNAGGVASAAPAISIGGSHAADFTIVTSGCTAALSPGGNCQVVVRFSPGVAGLRMATLTATATAGGTANAPLMGNGQTPGALDIDPATHDFGSILQGTAAPTRVFTITNTGQSPTTALSLRFTGSAASEMSLSADTCTGVSLPAAAFCTVTVQFLPPTAGSKTAGLEASASTGGVATAALSGRGLSPARFRLLPSPHTFASTLLDQTSATQDFTLSNIGEVATTAPTVSLGGVHATDFEQTSNGCTAALMPADSCVIRVRFHPTSSNGQRSASLNVSATTGGTAAAALAGLALAPANLTLTSPEGTDFGNVRLGSWLDLAFRVSNTGDIAAAGLTSTVSGPFSILGSGETADCTTTLVGGGTCLVRVRFRPTTAGAQTGTLRVTASPGGAPSPLTLTGFGQRPATLTPSLAMVSFGNAEVAVTSAAQRIVISNTGDLPSDPLQISSSQPTEFAFTGCTGALMPGATCDLDVTVRPLGVGARSATYLVQNGATSVGQASIPADATGVARLTWTTVGTGTVTVTPAGTSCGTNCALYPGGDVTMQGRTSHGSGFFFSGFTGSSACVGPARDCTISMNASRTITATFTALTTNLAFVSSAATPANLGGTAPYDAHCNTAATAAGINNAAGNAYIAWISDDNSRALTRLGAARNFVRMDGRVFTNDLASTLSLTDRRQYNSLIYDETGARVPNDSFVRTGMDSDGTPNGHCENWTGGGNQGYGSMPNSRWHINGGIGCTQPYPVYCMMKSFSGAGPTPPTAAGKLAFVTTTLTPSGGVAALDARCNAEKPAGSGSFKAMVNTTTTTAASVVNLSTTYVTPARQIVGTGSDLANYRPLQTGLWQGGDGSFLSPAPFILTGGGVPTQTSTATLTCDDYTTANPGSGYRTGYVNRSDGWWFSGFNFGCDAVDQFGVLCIEQ